MQSLPENGPIDDLLPHIEDIEKEVDNNNNDPEDSINSNFIPAPLPPPNEEHAIADTLSRIQGNNNTPIVWPNIDGSPINEFLMRRFLIVIPVRNVPKSCARLYQVG